MGTLKRILFDEKYIAEFNLILFLWFCAVFFYGVLHIIADWVKVFQYFF